MIPQTRTDLFLAKITGEDVTLPVPQTRFELYLANIAGESYELPAPNSRATLYLAKILGQDVVLPVPQTRSELYLASIAGMSVQLPAAPTTREEWYLARWAEDAGYVTITGNPVSFNAVAAKLKQLKIAFSPVQEGSGDPSPENERPIHGWTGVNVWQRGKNLFPAASIQGYVYSWYSHPNFADAVQPIFLKAGTTYVVSGERDPQYSTWFFLVRMFDTQGNNVTDVSKISGGIGTFGYNYVSGGKYFQPSGSGSQLLYQTITPAIDCYVDLCVQANRGEAANAMIEIGSTPSAAYVPYDPASQLIPVVFPDGEMYYGGWADPTTGDGIADMAAKDLGTLDWTYFSSSGIFRNLAIKTPNDRLGMCTRYKTVPITTWQAQPDMSIQSGTSDTVVKDSRYTDAAAFKAASSGVMFVYPLLTPIPFHVDPQQINSLAGANTMWTDADTLTVEYRKDGNVSDAEALSMLLGGRYTPATGPEDVSDSEALSIITGR